jgi:hypothetical protein
MSLASLSSSKSDKKIEEGTFFHFTQIPKKKKKKKNSLSPNLYQILNAKRERERLFERALIKG